MKKISIPRLALAVGARGGGEARLEWCTLCHIPDPMAHPRIKLAGRKEEEIERQRERERERTRNTRV